VARIIKAPNVKQEKPYRIVETEKVLRHADDDAADIIASAHSQEEEILKAAVEQADSIITDAEAQVEELRKQAQTEAEAIKEQAKQQGHQEGLVQGTQEAKKQVSTVVQQLQSMIAEGQKILEGMILDQEADVRQLTVEIVGRVIRQKIETDDEVVVRVAQECIRQAADRQKLRILVHPDNQQKIEEWAPEFSRMFDDIEKLSIEADPRVQPGGVIIESGAGGVDGRIDKQVEILNDVVINS